MGFFSHITRGGQIQIHQLRMIHQIFTFALIVSFMISLFYFAYMVKADLPKAQKIKSYDYTKALLLTSIGKITNNHEVTQEINVKGQIKQTRSSSILNNDSYKLAAAKTFKIIKIRIKHAVLCFLLSLVIILAIWFKYGQYQKKTDIVKGKRFIKPDLLKAELESTNLASDIKIEDLPLVKNSETKHILITGTTGAGKSNLINVLLPQIRKRPNKAIIIDVTGQYVAKYYNPKTDFILNPLDDRSINWNIWSDCEIDYHYESFAESMIPSNKNQDDIWDKSSRIVLVELLKKLKATGQCSTRKLLSIVNQNSLSLLEEILKDTNAAKLVAKEAEKTSFSVIMNLMSQISSLKYLICNGKTETDISNSFSIRNWVSREDNNSWLFITSRTDQLASLKNLISSVTDIAINSSLSLTPKENRRIWLIIDELPKLQYLPSLNPGLAEGRKYGLCIVAGIQTIPQLVGIYGYNIAQSMLDMFNSFFFFRCQNPQTSEWISKTLGVVEQEELHEQMSYGASTVKDGMSFSKQTKSKNLVLPIEIANLKDLEMYVKYASYDVTKLSVKYQVIVDKHLNFLDKKFLPNLLNENDINKSDDY